ncbi:unnamed protein product [Symbiodinium natans]|uniref:SMODS and SLOG-associating 2TM effector domain-containing protein n=1 Tax=Symbiodinium natans TaxID=878477 RepID=A0A812PPF4_9DINO|nr:unnamed protein product [Symbiodinium natans]
MATLTPENRRRRAKDDKDDDLDDADDFGALFEAPKRVALTAEQKVKLAEWYNIAETNLKIHQISEKKFEFLYFWVSVLPTLVLSSLTSVLSLLSDIFPNFQFWGLILATLSTLNGIIVGVSAFWKWQAKMEKGRFAAQEYDNLKQRLNLWRTKIEYNKMTFLMVLEEVEQTLNLGVFLNDIMKTCGPPDEYLVAKVKQEIAMQAFHAAKRLERRRQQVAGSAGAERKEDLQQQQI